MSASFRQSGTGSGTQGTEGGKARRLPGLPENWGNYFGAVLVILMLPLTPLAFEWLISGDIKNSALQLGAATYALAIGASSRNVTIFVLGLVLGVGFAVLYGGSFSLETANIDSDQGQAGNNDKLRNVIVLWGPMVGIFGVFILHAGERYNRHVVDGAPCFEFMKKEEGRGSQ